MKRTNISINSENMSTTLEFDEEYQAGNTVTTNAHFRHEFVKSENDLILLLVISDLTAPGFMGFFYKNFGSSTMGQAFLKSYKSYLES
ncbi:MAG: hypothetical protein HKN76_22685 [Saprospiraceae bacterium]|nr:hypothetical protein [Saprospiraceae bacterium]